MISTIVNRCKKLFYTPNPSPSTNRQKPKKQKSEEIDEPSPDEICNDRYMLIKRRSNIGNLITFRSKTKLDQKIYPEKKEAKPEPPPEITPETSPKTLHWSVIKVKIEVITGVHYKKIIEKYNEMKPSDWPPLERLDRAEGGFQLEIPEKRGIKCRNANDKIKQLRWKNKALVQHNYYITFNERELELLFNAMLDVLGKDVYVE